MGDQKYIEHGLYVALKQLCYIIRNVSNNTPVPFMDPDDQRKLKRLYDKTFVTFTSHWASLINKFTITDKVTKFIIKTLLIIQKTEWGLVQLYNNEPGTDLNTLSLQDPIQYTEDIKILNIHRYMKFYGNITQPYTRMVVKPNILISFIETIVSELETRDFDNVGKIYKFGQYNIDNYFSWWDANKEKQENALYDILDSIKLIQPEFKAFTNDIEILVNHIAKISNIELKEERPQKNNSTGETD